MYDGEPFETPGRLKAVHRTLRLTLIAIAVGAVVAAPAAAQSAGADLDATVGLDGWVAGGHPMHVRAAVDADVLFVGEIEVVYGGAATRIPVEVPAGGSKVYDVVVRPPLGQSNLTVRLVDDDGSRVEQLNVRPKVASEEIVVAVDRDDAIAARLGSARTAIDNVPIEPVVVPGTDIDLSPVSYLVAPSGTVDPSVWGWVRAGGRLVAGPQVVDAAPVPLTPIGSLGAGSNWYTYGVGEVVSTDVTTADWSAIIRPAPVALLSSDVWSSPENQLTRAATGASNTGLATLPWLLGAVVAYAAIVGPINLLILRRMDRRELAWVTIPLIALLALGGFWVAGRQRLESTTIRHATVSVGSGDGGYALSSVVLAAGSGGTRILEIEDATALYPVSVDTFNEFGGGEAASSIRIEANRAELQLPQLGVAATQIRRSPLPGPSVIAETLPDGALRVTLTNDTDTTIDYWGAALGSSVGVSPRSVAPGDNDTLVLRGFQQVLFDPGMGFGDVLVQERQLWDDERGWQVISPLGGAASAEIGFGRAAVYAISNEITVPVILDGDSRAVAGPVIYAVPFDAGDEPGGLTRVSGDVVSMQGVDFVEAYGSGAFIHAEVITLRFLVPTGVNTPSLHIGEGWARPSKTFEVYDWREGVFVEVAEGEPIDTERLASPAGEMLVHTFRQGEDQFSGEPISLGIVTLEWDA